MKILTNIRFHESPAWRAATVSLYPDHGAGGGDPLPPWAEARALARGAPGFDAVVTMGARECLCYGLWCALTGQPSRQVLSEFFIDPPARPGPAWRLKRSLHRWIARRALGALANSSPEVPVLADYLALPPGRVRFVPLNANRVETQAPPCDDGFILAAGRSHRDYPTLLAALVGIRRPLQILCGADDLRGIELPPGVEVHRELDRAAYLDRLRRCTFVVVPLRPSLRATGQVVALEAMALGKAVVATRVAGTVDYIEDGHTGLLVEPGRPDQLAVALQRLCRDAPLRLRLAEAGKAEALTRFSIAQHTQLKLDAIAALVQAAPGS